MKKFVLIVAIFLGTLSSISQKWEHIYGEPNRNDLADDIIETYDKGYYIVAGYEGNGWNIKTDINGYGLYDKFLFHDLYQHRNFGGAAIDDNGNIYVCGGILMDASWPIVTKYNSCGEKVWCRVFINDYFEDGVCWDILVTDNDKIIVLIHHNSDDQVDQILLYCLNSEGDLLWTKPYASKNEHPEIAVAIGYNLNYYNNSYFIDGYCYWPYPGNPGQVYLRPLFIKIDSLFNEEWVLPFGVADSIVGEAYGTIALNDSVYFGMGVRRSSATYNQNSLLMFFNDQGEEIGYNQIANEDFGENVEFNLMAKIAPIDDTSFVTKFYIGKNDTVYHGETVIDTSGTIHEMQIRGTGGAIPDMIKTQDNNFLVAIEVEENKGDKDIWVYKFDKNLESVPFDTNTYVYDSLCPGGIQSGSIDITDCLIWTDVKEMPSPKEYFASLQSVNITAFPNPAKKSDITLSFTNTEHFENMELRFFDVFGKKVHSQKIYKYQGESKVNIQNWKPGIYVALVYSGGRVVAKTKFVVQ
ncbi:MAG: T9SS type A sorting domain-containing protein [Bacteroidales bacterium]